MSALSRSLHRALRAVVGKLVGDDPHPRYSDLDEADGLHHRQAAPSAGSQERDDDADGNANAA
jgi:hypothetical protein